MQFLPHKKGRPFQDFFVNEIFCDKQKYCLRTVGKFVTNTAPETKTQLLEENYFILHHSQKQTDCEINSNVAMLGS